MLVSMVFAMRAAGLTVGSLIAALLIPVINDTVSQFADTYKPTHAAAYLIRPDGYIGHHLCSLALPSVASLAGAFVAQRVGQKLLFDAKRQVLFISHALDLEDVDPVIVFIRPVRDNRRILPIRSQ
jgi:hypothetical protein